MKPRTRSGLGTTPKPDRVFYKFINGVMVDGVDHVHVSSETAEKLGRLQRAMSRLWGKWDTALCYLLDLYKVEAHGWSDRRAPRDVNIARRNRWESDLVLGVVRMDSGQYVRGDLVDEQIGALFALDAEAFSLDEPDD